MSEVQWYPNKSVGGVDGWHWISSDTGAWDGPKMDWETQHYKNIIEPLRAFGKTRCVVQAGGCQGMYPKLLSRTFERVYTFEPDHLNFRALTLNCTEPNIYKSQAALGAVAGTVRVNVNSMENTGMHTVVDDPAGQCPQICLDSLSLDPDLIWLDVEGYERNVLIGAQQTITRYHPTIVVERASGEVVELLRGHGYSETGTSAMDHVWLHQG